MLVLLRQPFAAAQQSAQAREQDLQLERLRQVIVGAGFESLQHVFRAAARGQHQHRHVVAFGAQLLDDGEAVLAGQHHVEHDGVVARAIGEQAIERLLAVAVDIHLVAFGFEVEAQPVGEVRFVFDDEDPAHLRLARAFGERARSGQALTWQFERERRALVLAGAFGEDASAVTLGDRAHDVEAEPGALDLRAERLEAVKAIEDAPELRLAECRCRHP